MTVSFSTRILATPFADEWNRALSSSSQLSGATAPTISGAGNIISQDLEGLYKKVTIRFDKFLGNFREANLCARWTPDSEQERILTSSSDSDGSLYRCLYSSVIS